MSSPPYCVNFLLAAEMAIHPWLKSCSSVLKSTKRNLNAISSILCQFPVSVGKAHYMTFSKRSWAEQKSNLRNLEKQIRGWISQTGLSTPSPQAVFHVSLLCDRVFHRSGTGKILGTPLPIKSYSIAEAVENLACKSDAASLSVGDQACHWSIFSNWCRASCRSGCRCFETIRPSKLSTNSMKYWRAVLNSPFP